MSHNITLSAMLLSEIPSVYARALALAPSPPSRALQGVVSYLARQEHAGAIAGPLSPDVVAPPVTTSFDAKFPLDAYPKQDYVYVPQHTMRYLEKMHPYLFNQSILKFDPWFRQILNSKAPEVVAELENTYQRDPCTPDRIMKHMALFGRKWSRRPTGRLMKEAERIVEKMFNPFGQVAPIDFNFAGWHEILPQTLVFSGAR